MTKLQEGYSCLPEKVYNFSDKRQNDPSQLRTVERHISVNMYYSSPILLAKYNIEKLKICQFFNVINDGSRLWIYMVKMEKSASTQD